MSNVKTSPFGFSAEITREMIRKNMANYAAILKGFKMSNFWAIKCCDCGVNCDLLTDNHSRIICRECLNTHEFNEVENEIFSEGDSEKESVGNRDVLHCSSLTDSNDRNTNNEKAEAIYGVE